MNLLKLLFPLKNKNNWFRLDLEHKHNELANPKEEKSRIITSSGGFSMLPNIRIKGCRIFYDFCDLFDSCHLDIYAPRKSVEQVKEAIIGYKELIEKKLLPSSQFITENPEVTSWY